MAGNNKLMATQHGSGKCVVEVCGYSLLTACVAIMISVMTITASRPIRNKNRPCMNCDSRKRNVLARRLKQKMTSYTQQVKRTFYFRENGFVFRTFSPAHLWCCWVLHRECLCQHCRSRVHEETSNPSSICVGRSNAPVYKKHVHIHCTVSDICINILMYRGM